MLLATYECIIHRLQWNNDRQKTPHRCLSRMSANGQKQSLSIYKIEGNSGILTSMQGCGPPPYSKESPGQV